MQSRASQGDKVLFWGYVALHVSSTLPWGRSPDSRGGPAAGGRSEAVPDPWGGGDRAGRVQWDRGRGERSWQGVSSLQPSPRGQGQGSSRAPTARQQALGTHRVYSLLVSASRSLEIHSAALLTHYTSPLSTGRVPGMVLEVDTSLSLLLLGSQAGLRQAGPGTPSGSGGGFPGRGCLGWDLNPGRPEARRRLRCHDPSCHRDCSSTFRLRSL